MNLTKLVSEGRLKSLVVSNGEVVELKTQNAPIYEISLQAKDKDGKVLFKKVIETPQDLIPEALEDIKSSLDSFSDSLDRSKS